MTSKQWPEEQQTSGHKFVLSADAAHTPKSSSCVWFLYAYVLKDGCQSKLQ